MKMFLVEDDPGYSGLILKYFEGLVDEIVHVPTWQAAEKYLQDSWTVYWIDIFVPGIYHSDQALLRIADLRKRDEKSTILAVTGFATAELSAQALAAGADLFVNKLDTGTRKQAVASLILALMIAAGRGYNVEKYLIKARELLQDG